MTKALYIIGTGGFSKEVAQLAALLNAHGKRWSSIEYLCEHEEDIGMSMPFGKVTGTDARLKDLDLDAEYVIGIGIPKVRRRIAERLDVHPRLTAPNLIHPLAGCHPDAVRMGRGNIVTHGTVFTCDILVGDHNVFNLNSTVGHDARIGSYCVINPGCNISGGVTLGDGCLLGTGSRILERLPVAADVLIGAGAVLTRAADLPGATYVGMPAKAKQP